MFARIATRTGVQLPSPPVPYVERLDLVGTDNRTDNASGEVPTRFG